MTAPHIKTGNAGEERALRYLTELGYVLLAQNYRAERAELDLIMRDGREIVFIEVKTRQNSGIQTPEAAVTPEKQKRMARAAEVFLYENSEEQTFCRFDIVAISMDKKPPHDLRHLPDAFRL